MASKIIILHQYGAPEHHSALAHLAQQAGISIEYREFGFIRQFAKGLIERNFRKMMKAASNGAWLLIAWLGMIRKHHVVVGIAPFDPRILAILPILYNNDCFWHTSWPYWDGNRVPKPTTLKLIRIVWCNFINAKLRGVIFVTAYARDNFRKTYGPTLPAWVVPHSYDPSIYFPMNRSERMGLTIGFVGRLDDSKGILLVLEIAKMNFSYPLKVIIAGKGPYQPIVEAAALASGGKIEYRGFLDSTQLANLYREIDFLMLPSFRTPDWEEAFGMVIIEAMACGAIPITTDHPGPKEILADMFKENVLAENEFKDGALRILDDAVADPGSLTIKRINVIQYAKQYSVNVIATRWDVVLPRALE